MSTDLTKEDLTSDSNTKMSEINKSSIKTATINNQTETTKALQKKKKKIPICNICREKVTKETYIRCPICKQYFCKFCIEDWLISVKNNRICPLCAKKWDDNFICNNLPLGFVVNTLKLRVYGLYSNDYEYETKNKNMHYTDKEDESHEENEEENHEEDEEENHEEENHEEENHEEEDEHHKKDENHDENHEEDERHREHEESHEEHHDESHRTNRERLLDFILNADAIGEDQESINLVRMLLLSDLLDH